MNVIHVQMINPGLTSVKLLASTSRFIVLFLRYGEFLCRLTLSPGPRGEDQSCELRLLEGEQDADHEGEERRAFDQTGDAVHGGGGELTDAVAGTDDGETSAETGTEVGEHCRGEVHDFSASC